jgi:hypothetical protein
MPKSTRTVPYVLHEAAHVVVLRSPFGYAAAAHGPVFGRVYADLLRRFAPIADADVTASFRAERVKLARRADAPAMIAAGDAARCGGSSRSSKRMASRESPGFRVPAGFGVFADLDNDRAMLREEYGIPAYTAAARRGFLYPAWARLNVLHRLWSCATAVVGGASDPETSREAGRILAWVRRHACDCERGGRWTRAHPATCAYRRIADFAFDPVAGPPADLARRATALPGRCIHARQTSSRDEKAGSIAPELMCTPRAS